MLRRELANAISLISLGSNHILRFPHFKTEDAKRFCNLSETEIEGEGSSSGGEKLGVMALSQTEMLPWIKDGRKEDVNGPDNRH